MEQPVFNYFLEGEAPQGTAERMEEEARKEIRRWKFSEALTSPKPAKAWQRTVYGLLAGAYLVPEFYREYGLEGYLAGVALERLEYLERFTLRPLEFEAGQGEDLPAFDKAQQVAKAKAFLDEVRAALEAGQFSPICWGDFDKDGNPRYIPGTAGERTFETDVKGRPWPGSEEYAQMQRAWGLLQGIAERWKGTRPFADRKSFERVHWLNLARKLKAWKVKRESAPSEERFREELKAEFEKLEGQISAKFNKWKPQDSQPRFDVIGLPRGWGLDGSEEAQAYFYTLLTHTLERELLTALFLQDEAQAPKKAPTQQEPSTKVLALRTYFLYRADYLPELNEGKGLKAGLAAIAEREGVSAGSLINVWYAINKNSDKNPLKLSILERVLPTLTDFPEALKLAEEELEQLKKKSNPRK